MIGIRKCDICTHFSGNWRNSKDYQHFEKREQQTHSDKDQRNVEKIDFAGFCFIPYPSPTSHCDHCICRW